jgi:hypothetical protein
LRFQLLGQPFFHAAWIYAPLPVAPVMMILDMAQRAKQEEATQWLPAKRSYKSRQVDGPWPT